MRFILPNREDQPHKTAPYAVHPAKSGRKPAHDVTRKFTLEPITSACLVIYGVIISLSVEPNVLLADNEGIPKGRKAVFVDIREKGHSPAPLSIMLLNQWAG